MTEELFPSVSAGEYQRRYEAIWQEMESEGLDALVLYGDSSSHGGGFANVVYLAGYADPLFAYVILPRGQKPRLLISNSLYLPHAQVMADVDGVDWVSWDPGARMGEMLTQLGLASARIGLTGVRGIQKSSLPHDHVVGMQRALPQATFSDATELLQRVRRIKSAEEVALLRRGAQITDATVAALAEQTRVGMTEHDLAAIIYSTAHSKGGDQRLVFVGSTPMDAPELVFPRQEPSQRRLRPGDIVLTELSSGYAGYAGQIHRPLVIGAEPTAEYQQLFDVAREMFDAVLQAVGPGGTDEDMRQAARSTIAGTGLWTMDALVHGWGLTIEPPRLDIPELAHIQRPQEAITFSPGMVMVVQPHILSADKRRGLQLGSLVVVNEDGAEALQQFPMQFISVAE